MPKNRTMFRSDVSRGILAVDEKKEIIEGFSVISIGEALGHGVDIDLTTLEQVVELGNKTKDVGLKSRFGHPNMSSEALGTALGRSKNFRLSEDGQRALADLHISKASHNAPGGDLGGYVISLAAEDPKAFGASIVFDMEIAERLEEDGTRQKDENTGEELRPLARVKQLFAADVVDEPAANENGFLGHKFFMPDVKLSAEATGFLDKFLSMPDAVDKFMGFLGKYSENRDLSSGKSELKVQEIKLLKAKIAIEELKLNTEDEMTKEELFENHPDLMKSICDESLRIGADAGINVERQRIKDIEAQSIPGHEDLIESLKFDGKTTGPEAAVQVLAAEKLKLKGMAAQRSIDAPPPVKDLHPEERIPNGGESKDSAISKYKADHDCTYREAMLAVGESRPELFKNKNINGGQ